ncbi:MAG: hypothetical protein JXA30_16725 [Deltaproteobacteria bacterium]|nr:hypothetical protein [Deltaproteobacteria bacterium]
MTKHRLNQRSQFATRWLALATVATLASSADALEVDGKLLVGAYRVPAESASARRSYYWELENGVKEVARSRIDAPRELAVVLLGDNASENGKRFEVEFYGGSLLPSTIVVRKGSTLRINNKDEIAHEVYAKGLKAFGPETISPRAIRSIELKEAGSWQLYDRLVTHVRGQLHVLANLVAIAKVNPDGEYSFSDVEPGNYTLRVYHGAKLLVEKPVEVVKRDNRKKEIAIKLDPITLTNSSKPE